MTAIETPASAAWLTALRSYLLFVIPANLVWEIAHLPLYTFGGSRWGNKHSRSFIARSAML
jgi:hypothetical protein